MLKVSCVFSFRASSWVSCQKIVFNLLKAYEGNPSLKLTHHNLSRNLEAYEVKKLAQEIYDNNPEIVAFLDHLPHPRALLAELIPLYQSRPKPRIVFHVFGDFTLNLKQWRDTVDIVQGMSVEFIVASERQKLLIDQFLSYPQIAKICPFPVDESEFSYDENLRKKQRQDWNLKADDVAFVFTGRLSRQKRIHTLIKTFANIVFETKSQKAHLYLYGNPDSIGDPFMAKWEIEGEYFRKINKLYRSLPQEIQDKIHFMGSVPNAELKAVYHGADALVNLSVHNDEDYGMSVAEAQCSGLKTITTDWGGLASFRYPKLEKATRFIPVRIGVRAKVISLTAVTKAFMDHLSEDQFSQRHELSTMAQKSFGVKTAKNILIEIFNHPPAPFEGFSSTFNELVESLNFTYTPFLTDERKITPLYRKIYSAYVRPD